MANFTALQTGFINYYVVVKNGTKAARLAGYKGNDNVLAVTAHDNLRNPKIKAEIERRFGEQAMNSGEVLARLGDMARTDMSDFIEPATLEIDLVKAEAAAKLHLIKKFTHTIGKETENFSIELYDAQAALETIGKHLGLFNTVKIEDWRTQAIADIRAGKIPYEALVEAFDADLATQLFTAAGVPVQVGQGAQSAGAADADGG